MQLLPGGRAAVVAAAPCAPLRALPPPLPPHHPLHHPVTPPKEVPP